MFTPAVVDIIRIHDRILEVSGGLNGIRDNGLLESAVNKPHTHIFGIERYKNTYTKAASLLESIAIYHPFNDGNKRTAMAIADLYLYFNGFQIEYTNEEYEKFMLTVVNKRLTIKQIANWLKEHKV